MMVQYDMILTRLKENEHTKRSNSSLLPTFFKRMLRIARLMCENEASCTAHSIFLSLDMKVIASLCSRFPSFLFSSYSGEDTRAMSSLL